LRKQVFPSAFDDGYLFSEVCGELHEFGLGSGGVEVVVGDAEHVIVTLDLMIQMVCFDYFIQDDLALRFLVGELPPESVVPAVEIVGGQQVGYGDLLVKILLGCCKDDVLGDPRARSHN